MPQFRSTYRLQLQRNFGFADAAAVTGYLEELGVSHLYLSPILEAREGSNHGYDTVDPTRVSQERGGEESFKKLADKVARSRGLEGLILDVVPNHVAASWRNPAWWDVLKCGPESRYWRTFDVRPRAWDDWRVVLPVLGRSRQAVIAARELRIGLHEGELVLAYWDSRYPIAEKSYARILRALAAECTEAREVLLEAAAAKVPARALQRGLARRESRGRSTSFAPLEEIKNALRRLPIKVVEQTAEEQHYALEEWRRGSREINYRRFFDINDLAAIRVEDPKVFRWAHSKIHELVRSHDVIQGLRVDHVDGLTDPETYLRQLRKISPHVWVEKILGDGEQVPEDWPVEGTTGYEFSGLSARLFVDLPGVLHLHAHYTLHVDRRWERFHDCVYDSKREMLESHFASEFKYLSEQLYALATRERRAKKFPPDELAQALLELTASLRVYRVYSAPGRNNDSRWLREAFAEAEGRGHLPSTAALDWLRSILLSRGDWSEDVYALIKRWEQLTGPVMAKGLEDTALYRYFPLLSLNVVGGEPDWSGDGVVEFHAFNQERRRRYPYGMSATSTHDTKRSEDVRSRIHVISELAEEWTVKFEEWRQESQKILIGLDQLVPGPALEYMIYETLMGTWPMDGKITAEFISRLKAYFIKAVREAKSETSWIEPNQPYEEAVQKFVERLLRPSDGRGRALLQSLREFAERCAFFGAFNSLSLLTLKVLSPGLPDFYQGCELWDLSLVDPDNRRPVDFHQRRTWLREMKQSVRRNRREYLAGVLNRWKTGEVKLWLTWELLQLRRRFPELFAAGEYIALEPRGDGRHHFIAFLRRYEKQWALVVVPRLLSDCERPGRKLQIREARVRDAEIPLPPQAPQRWTHVLSGAKLKGDSWTAGTLLCGMPVGVLIGSQ